MKKIKILSVFGTRPEASKMAPLILKFKEYPEIESRVCVTAQHRGMLDQILSDFGITPDYDLNIMRERQSLSDITVSALKSLEDVYSRETPDLILVHGDTTTTFSASLAAFYAGTKLGHVEAGLRTYDKYQPYPEEINRKLVTALADLNFAPTSTAKDNLLRESIPADSIFVTGNTSVDSTKYAVGREGYRFACKEINSVDFSRFKVISMTAHRRENLGEPHKNIFRAVRRLIDENRDLFLVYPVHPNPLVRDAAESILGGHERILLTEPVDLFDMYNLISGSYIVLTDSGGLQEEAPAFRKPVVVLRNVTERPEGIEAGTLVLAGTEEGRVYSVISELLNDKALYSRMAGAKNPFGDGEASARISEAILYHFGLREKRPEDFV